MLQAIILNKAGRNISSDEIHWRELFRTSEDSLTSTIFGLLNYLPYEMFWDILLKSCYGNYIPNNSNKIIEYAFWPRWNPVNTQNSNLVEPDLFISTVDYDIILEAKRYDYNQQNPSQWKAEFQAYLNEFGILNKKVFLIALGGIYNENMETIILNEEPYLNKEIQIVKCRWSRILKAIKEIHSKIENDRVLLNSISSVYNILSDLILGFRIHGYYTGEWFEKTDFSELTNLNYTGFEQFEEINLYTPKFQWGRLLQYNSIDMKNYYLLENNYERPYKRSI